MAENRGKQFEEVIKESFLKVHNVSIDRLHDQTNGFAGSSNICDFIVFREPYQYYIECKAVHGNTLSINSIDKNGKGEIYGNITKKQWKGMLEKSKILGVYAGVMCWFIDHDVTMFIPIQTLQMMKELEYKSVRYDISLDDWIYVPISGKKKRVFFDYDMNKFLRIMEDSQRRIHLCQTSSRKK